MKRKITTRHTHNDITPLLGFGFKTLYTYTYEENNKEPWPVGQTPQQVHAKNLKHILPKINRWPLEGK